MCPADYRAICGPEGALCAPCGAELAGPSVAITFSYDYFDVVVLRTEFEARLSLTSGTVR